MTLSPFMQLALLLAIILVVAKLSGYLSVQMRQPSVLGELLVGLLIGPSLLNLLHWPVFTAHPEEVISELAELGVLLLMFVAGLELHLSELAKSSKVSAFAGILGVLFPFVLGWGTALLFGLKVSQAVFMGLALGATSVSISAQTLMELRVLRTRVGLGMLGAAVFDDILVILLLSGFVAWGTEGASLASVAWIFVRMIIFFIFSTAFGLWFLPWIIRRVVRLPISQGGLSLALVVMLIYGFAAEYFGGMAAITGAFLAGLMFGRCAEKENIERGISALSYGLFVPIFFVNIGLSINLGQLEPNFIWLALAISAMAILGKLFGAGLGARAAGFSLRESVQLGAGMISRGEVGLIIASVGITEGLIGSGEFSAIVVMVLVTTLVTPPLLRALFKQPMRNQQGTRTALKKEAD